MVKPALPALQARVIRIEEEIKGIKGGMEALAKGLDSQSERLYAAMATLSNDLNEARTKEAEHREVSWPLVLTIIGTLGSLSLIGAALIGMYVSLVTAPLHASLEGHSIRERDMQQELSALRATAQDMAVMKVQVQLYTQLANERQQSADRISSLIWHKAFGSPLPPKTYYPELEEKSYPGK